MREPDEARGSRDGPDDRDAEHGEPDVGVGPRDLPETVGRKEERKIRARREKPERSLWFGLGMFGLVGWSVAIPTVLGIALGVWLDRRYPGQVSWTLTMLLVGVALGCLNAWYWVKRAHEGR